MQQKKSWVTCCDWDELLFKSHSSAFLSRWRFSLINVFSWKISFISDVVFSMLFKLNHLALAEFCYYEWRWGGDKRPRACQCYIFISLHFCGLFFFFFFKVCFSCTLLLITAACLFKSTMLVCSSVLCVLVGMGVWHGPLKCYLLLQLKTVLWSNKTVYF